jgi:hypothetical protein
MISIDQCALYPIDQSSLEELIIERCSSDEEALLTILTFHTIDKTINT